MKKRIKLILILLFVITIIILILPNKESKSASYPCPQCGNGMWREPISGGEHIWGCYYDGTRIYERHYGGTHFNHGTCIACGEQYQIHEENFVKRYEINQDQNTHTEILICRVHDNVKGIYECLEYGHERIGNTTSHSGGEHNNGGHCTLCTAKYQNHGKSNNIVDYSKLETSHTPIYACIMPGCTARYNGTAANHTGATHANGGKCTTCGRIYQTHSKKAEISRYTSTKTDHTPIHECGFSGCKETYADAKVAHSGATHDNEGICTICRETYQDHIRAGTTSKYITTDTEHTPIYSCTFTGCQSEIQGETTSHTGGSHENDGRCTVCDKKYQTHSETKNLSYEITDTTHTPAYECSLKSEGCTYLYKKNTENHLGGTHDNEGKCATCDATYQNHSQSDTIEKYRKTSTTHIPIYLCTFEGCESTYIGESTQHTFTKYTDNGNKTHTVECDDCEYQEIEEHIYEDGKCMNCGAEEKSSRCTHNYIKKTNEKQHWEECEKCEEVKEGTLKNHTFEKYTDNENGTHSSVCTECSYKLTAEHNYEDGKCTECDAEEKSKECEHSYTKKSNGTQHWEECEKCKEIKNGTLKDHSFNYTNNNDGTHTSTCKDCEYKLTEKHTNNSNNICQYCKANSSKKEENTTDNKTSQNNTNVKDPKDNTVAPGKLPYTGFSLVTVICIMLLAVISTFSIFKLKEYDDVK